MTRLAASLALCFSTGAAVADVTAPVFDFVESGLLCPTVVVGRQEAPGTIAGELRLIDGDHPIAVRTDRVPLELGAEFGVRSRLRAGQGNIAAQVTVIHPPVPPSGQSVERWFTTLSDQSNSVVAFTFEERNELQPGTWTFRIEAEGRVLIERNFTVTGGLDLSYQRMCEAPAVTS